MFDSLTFLAVWHYSNCFSVWFDGCKSSECWSSSPLQCISRSVWTVSMGEVPAGTALTGEMLASPGPDRQTVPCLWWTRASEVPSFSVSHFLSSSSLSLFFFTFGLHQNREDFFPVAVLFRKADEGWSAFVEFGLVVLKMEFDPFSSAPSICSSHSPSVELGLDQFVPLINFLLIYHIPCALAKQNPEADGRVFDRSCCSICPFKALSWEYIFLSCKLCVESCLPFKHFWAAVNKQEGLFHLLHVISFKLIIFLRITFI